MTFSPVLPSSGLPGWTLLNRTMERQTELFNQSPRIVRDTEYFEKTIATVKSADDLVSDRRLLRVTLGAFGLQEDIDSRAFIRTVLEEGTVRDDALANRLSDPRYKQLAGAFGLAADQTSRVADPGFGARITDQFRRREFEVAVGDQDQSLRLALNAERELGAIATDDTSETAKWFGILGNTPLRQVFQTALGLPESFAQLDLDRQVDEIKSRAQRQLDITSLSDLADTDRQEELIRRFLVRDQIAGFNAQSSQSIALTLLQSAPRAF